MIIEKYSEEMPANMYWKVNENRQDKKFEYFLKYLPLANSSQLNSIFYIFNNRILPASLNYFVALGYDMKCLFLLKLSKTIC